MQLSISLLLSLLLLTAAAAKEPIAIEPSDCGTPVACAMQSVVSVLPDRPAGTGNSEEPEGSGVAIGDGRMIVTAYHVIGRAKRVLVRTAAGVLMDADVAQRDPSTDIALLKVAKPLPPIKFGPHPGHHRQCLCHRKQFWPGRFRQLRRGFHDTALRHRIQPD